MTVGASAQAATSPITPQGVDLEFQCSSSGERVACQPQAGRYGRYARLANWRIVDETASGSCLYGSTYGYGRQGPWVAGDCQATFRAPNLRFGDTYNAQRAPVHAPRQRTTGGHGSNWWHQHRPQAVVVHDPLFQPEAN